MTTEENKETMTEEVVEEKETLNDNKLSDDLSKISTELELVSLENIELKAEIAKLESEIETLNNEAAVKSGSEHEVKEYIEAITSLKGEIKELEGRKSELKGQVELEKDINEKFQKRIEELEKTIVSLRQENDKLIRKLEKDGLNRNAKTYSEFIKDKENEKEFNEEVKKFGKQLHQVESGERQAIVNRILKRRGVI